MAEPTTATQATKSMAPATNPAALAAPPTKGPQARFNNLQALLKSQVGSFAALLPKHLTPDRMLRVGLSAASRNLDLLDCTPESFVLALALASYLGLEPNTPLQRGYLIPYMNKGKREVQFIPGYKGLIWLATQSGEIASIESHVAYEKERFVVKLGTAPSIDHAMSVTGRGAPIAFYAVATMRSGAKTFEVMTIEQVEEIRKRSQSGESGPWKTDFEQMARKTVIRRLMNYLPLSEQRVASAMTVQAKSEAGEAPDFADILDAAPGLAEIAGEPATVATVQARGEVSKS